MPSAVGRSSVKRRGAVSCSCCASHHVVSSRLYLLDNLQFDSWEELVFQLLQGSKSVLSNKEEKDLRRLKSLL